MVVQQKEVWKQFWLGWQFRSPCHETRWTGEQPCKLGLHFLVRPFQKPGAAWCRGFFLFFFSQIGGASVWTGMGCLVAKGSCQVCMYIISIWDLSLKLASSIPFLLLPYLSELGVMSLRSSSSPHRKPCSSFCSHILSTIRSSHLQHSSTTWSHFSCVVLKC